MEMDRRDGIGLAPVILFPFYRNEFYLSNQLVLVVVVMVNLGTYGHCQTIRLLQFSNLPPGKMGWASVAQTKAMQLSFFSILRSVTVEFIIII